MEIFPNTRCSDASISTGTVFSYLYNDYYGKEIYETPSKNVIKNKQHDGLSFFLNHVQGNVYGLH